MKKDWVISLSKIAKKKNDETLDKRKKVQEKRSRRKAKTIEARDNAVDSIPNFDSCLKPYGQSSLDDSILVGERNCGQTIKNKINWYCVQKWFVSAMHRNNPDWLAVDDIDDKLKNEKDQTWWTHAEKNCATRLLKHYGAETVESTINWYCDNWDAIVDNSDGRLSGAPSIKLLWASRDRFFADAKIGKTIIVNKHQKSKKRHMVGEFDADRAAKRSKVGWD